MLGTLYPKPKEFIANERETLKFLMDSAAVATQYPVLAADAQTAYHNQGAKSAFFLFNSFIEVEHEGARRRLYIGGLIESQKKTYTHITYSLAVGNCANRELLRKFHFDVALRCKNARQAQPLFHLQYCGKLSPYLTEQGYLQNHVRPLHPWLSEPRIFSTPMSLALLLDLVLHEFPDEPAVLLRSTQEWQALVRRNQALLLHKYYRQCMSTISNKKLLSEVFDVK